MHRVGESDCRPFVFSDLRVSDDEDTVCQSDSIVKALGTVEVRIHRVKISKKAAVFKPVQPQSLGTSGLVLV